MDKKGFLSPAEIVDACEDTGEKKAHLSRQSMALLGLVGGVGIAFASEGSTMAAYNLLANADTYGLGRVLAGAVFPTGLMLVILAGGELFTGNVLMITGYLKKRLTLLQMLRNWGWVYLFNFIGAVFLAFMMAESSLFNSSAGLFGGVTVKIAYGKIALPFVSAFFLGIMCNWLVCLAVWISTGAQDMAGKIFGIFFPIWLFITSGFEHCVANMYYVPAGIMAKATPEWAAASGLSAEALADLTWMNFFLNNLLPVTLGNIVGGMVFVGMLYWYAYKKG